MDRNKGKAGKNKGKAGAHKALPPPPPKGGFKAILDGAAAFAKHKGRDGGGKEDGAASPADKDGVSAAPEWLADFGFTVTTGDKSLILAAGSEEERSLWIKAIKERIAVFSDSKCGFLTHSQGRTGFVQGALVQRPVMQGGDWRKGFFLLQLAELAAYKTHDMYARSAQLQLVGNEAKAAAAAKSKGLGKIKPKDATGMRLTPPSIVVQDNVSVGGSEVRMGGWTVRGANLSQGAGAALADS